MQTISHWYKTHIRWILLVFSVLICAGLNIDTIAIAQKLVTDSVLRQSVELAAANYVRETTADKPSREAFLEQYQELTELHVPMGWTLEKFQTVSNWPMKVIGLLLTILATSAGAPFWYDLLRRLAGFRSGGQAAPTSG
jgi:hypothetical protein